MAENTLQDFGYMYDDFGNLAARKDNNRNLEETFTYDHLNRLTDVWLNNVHTGHMSYDELGRMTGKMADGQQVFGNAQYGYTGPDGQLRPHAVSSAETNYNPFPTEQQDITYTMFDKVGTITQPYNNGLYTLSYAYGYNHQRRRIVENYGNAVFRKKIYGDHCEFVTENSYNSSSTFLTGPLGVFAVVEKKNGSDRLHYVYKDHLGSWTMITDARGNIEQEVSFDAWGNLRDPETWSGEYNRTLMFDRGFTGHEHVMFGQLINMNGRMYDPIMSSFLSVDNYVQAPDFSQSFNRYAYCWNNPLRYTDPDGEWVQYVIGGLLGAWNGYSIGKAAGLSGWDLVWSTVGGAAVGAVSGGIGTYVSSVSTAAVGGLCGGIVSGAGNGLIQGLATDSKTLGADVLNGLWKGGLSGMVGGYVGGGIGIYGGKGAFLGGIAGSLTNELCNAATIDGYKVNWLNVGMGGVMSFGIYHAQAFAGYMAGGFYKRATSGINSPKLTYKEYCELLAMTQKSMRTGREGKFIPYFDKEPLCEVAPDGVVDEVSCNLSDYRSAKMDYHTHPKYGSSLAGGEGFSTKASAVSQGLPESRSDEYVTAFLRENGYMGPRYLGTREGHIWHEGGMINYDYSSSFYFYQHVFLFNLRIR